MLANLKPSVREPLIVYGTGLILTILSVIFFSVRGYPLVSTATETLNIVVPLLYMIPIFLPYGILLGEVIWIWNDKERGVDYILLFIECVVVGIFSFIRYIIGIPFSGHAILLFFYIPHQAINNRFQYKLRFLIGIIVLIITGFYKILLWDDLITFVLGAALGIALWVPGFFHRLKKVK